MGPETLLETGPTAELWNPNPHITKIPWQFMCMESSRSTTYNVYGLSVYNIHVKRLQRTQNEVRKGYIKRYKYHKMTFLSPGDCMV